MEVAWTGHRPELFASPEQAEAVVRSETARLLEEYGRDLEMLSGGQRGVDLWAARAALEQGLRLRLLLPCPLEVFAAGWPAVERQLLERAAATARLEVFGSDSRDDQGYRARNAALARDCDLLIAVWTGRRGGGTGQTIEMAIRLGRLVRQRLLPGSNYEPRPGERGV